MRLAITVCLPVLLAPLSTFAAEPAITRGAITDRNGEPLAKTEPAFQLRFLPDAQTQDPEKAKAAVATLREILGREPKITADKLAAHSAQSTAGALPVEYDLPSTAGNAIRAAGLKNWEAVEWQRRVYPQKNLAAHLLGYVGTLRTKSGLPEGRSGLEKQFDADLAKGARLVTSLDVPTQRAVTKILAETRHPGAIVVLDAQNAEVLAMASGPDFDPNQFIPSISAADFEALTKVPATPLLDRVVSAAFAPASTFRPFVGLAVAKTGHLDPAEMIPCPPSIQIGTRTFQNARSSSEVLDLAGAIRRANHVYFFQATLEVDGKKLSEGLAEFGFGSRTGVGLPGERAGFLPLEENQPKGLVANISIGQGTSSVTTLQLGRAMVALTNGGALMEPRLALKLVAPNGDLLREFPGKKERDLAFPAAARQAVMAGLVGAVQEPDGTSRSAKIESVKVAGVSGTTDIPPAPENQLRARGTFVGFAPTENPKFVVAITLEQCEGGADATATAAKVFTALAEKR